MRNKERDRATYAKWYAVNKERKKASHAIWLEANKERVAATSEKYRIKKRDQMRVEAAARRATQPAKVWPIVTTQKKANPEKSFVNYKGSTELRETNSKGARNYRARNLDARRLADREHARSHREHRKELHKVWASKNKEYLAAYAREWRKTANLARLSRNRTGDHRTKKSTPAWANKFIISEIYALARLRSMVMSIPWEVDHVIPLNGKTVSGLHVENNLRVIQRKPNRSKGNLHAS